MTRKSDKIDFNTGLTRDVECIMEVYLGEGRNIEYFPVPVPVDMDYCGIYRELNRRRPIFSIRHRSSFDHVTLTCKTKYFTTEKEMFDHVYEVYPDSCINSTRYKEVIPKEKIMKFEEALVLYQEGKKVRCVDWYKGDFIDSRPNAGGVFRKAGYDELNWSPNSDDLISSDWEEYLDLHNWDWAYAQMKAGERVRRANWANQSACIRISNGKIRFLAFKSIFNIGITDLDADNWTLAE